MPGKNLTRYEFQLWKCGPQSSVGEKRLARRSTFVLQPSYIRGTLMVHLYTTCSKLEIRNLIDFNSLKITTFGHRPESF